MTNFKALLTTSPVSPGRPITSVIPYYNGTSATGGMLLFTGTTYQLSVQDNYGNVLANNSGTWASTDATNFPVNSSGLVSPAAGIGGGNVTFTHTATGLVGTVPISVLKQPAVIYAQDIGTNYPSGTGGAGMNNGTLMGKIRKTAVGVDPTYNGGLPAPQNTSGWLYGDGQGANHFSIDSTTAARQFMGNPVIVQTFPTTTPAHSGSLATVVSSAFTRGWGLQVIRFDPGFTMVGAGVGSAALKIGNWLTFSPGGRAGMELTNGNNNGGTGGHPGGNFDLGCVLQSGVTTYGGQATQTLPNVTTEFYAGETWVSILLYEVRGGNIMSSRAGWFKVGTVPNLTFGNLTVEGPMTGVASPTYRPPAVNEYQPTAVNYNQAPPVQQLALTIPRWMLINGDTQGDPFGVLNDTSSPTLTGITGGTITHGDTSDSIVLTGTNFTKNCHPQFSNAKIYPQSITINSSTQMTVVVAVDPTATTGAGTVAVNNLSSQQTSATQVVTVT